jgi:glycerol-3-phosphate dehydrogenase
MLRRFYACAIVIALAGAMTPALAEEAHVAPVKKAVQAKVMSWLADPAMVSAIKAQNQKNSGLSQADVDKLDKQWRAEVKSGGGPLSQGVLSNALSAFLKKVKTDSAGLFTEIFVMDNKGLNVGQSDLTSDYWQGDEGKWKKTFLVGPGTVFVDKVQKDESTQALQSQASVSIVDPATNQVIGAVTVGINVDRIE